MVKPSTTTQKIKGKHQMNKDFIPQSQLSTKSFTLIELIVVIIIVGILAALGISQYSKMVEKGREAEAKSGLGLMRTLVREYRLANGSIAGASNADVGVGPNADQLPDSCKATHWFRFQLFTGVDSWAVAAFRCMSGGKTPSYPAGYTVAFQSDGNGENEFWVCASSSGYGWATGGVCP
ncbi:prepilin-type N-terminal cleavage/methylation domain-containing protein [bacterium]|nr:MAG: prepilin-type N-terminal cleavage/methylation domain-containing protein [bacterium]